MKRETDWIELWRELVAARGRSWRGASAGADEDVWGAKAREFHAATVRRWRTPDSSRDLIAARLDAHPGATVLDIGAGTGAWAAFMARRARSVTAVEPSGAMIEVMKEHLAAERVTNVEIVQGAWPHVSIGPHDYSLCSQAMYGDPDLPGFVRRMIRATRRECFLLMRAPTADGVMAEAARRVWGHPHDSPNFQVAYNVLLQMGICAHVRMEDSGLWEPWTSPSLDEALSDIKRRIGLGVTSEHDAFLADLVRRHLTFADGCYRWPRGVRSALIHWDVNVEPERGSGRDAPGG
jgi:SAM-dependent methyltransferase